MDNRRTGAPLFFLEGKSMHRRTPWLMTLAVLLCAAVLAQAAKARPAKTKLASTPEEAVTFVAEAMRAGDPDAVLAQTAEPNYTMLSLQMKMMRALEGLEAALEKKFGKDPKRKGERASIKESMQRTMRIMVVGKKMLGNNEVQLTIWQTGKDPFEGKKERITETTWTAVKVGKGWKLLLPMGGSTSSDDLVTRKGPDGKEVKVQIMKAWAPKAKEVEFTKKFYPKYLATMEKIKREVEKGKYKSRTEVEKALKAAGEALQKENAPSKDENRNLNKGKDLAAKDKK
jgi:hypothetical protein